MTHKQSNDRPAYTGGKYRDYLLFAAFDYKAGLLTDDAMLEAFDFVIQQCGRPDWASNPDKLTPDEAAALAGPHETIVVHAAPTRPLIELLSGADGVTPSERLRAWGAVIWEQPCHAIAKDPGGSLLSLTNKGLAELIAQI